MDIDPILVCAPAVVESGTTAFTMAEARGAIARVAEKYGTDMIDHYSATRRLIDAGNTTWLADGLHPNDAGHLAMFERVRAAIDAA
jgi:lysophospholipase L1-like esterase